MFLHAALKSSGIKVKRYESGYGHECRLSAGCCKLLKRLVLGNRKRTYVAMRPTRFWELSLNLSQNMIQSNDRQAVEAVYTVDNKTSSACMVHVCSHAHRLHSNDSIDIASARLRRNFWRLHNCLIWRVDEYSLFTVVRHIKPQTPAL